MAGVDSELHTGGESDSDSDDEDYVPAAGEDSEASASEKDDQEEGNSDSEVAFCKKKTNRAQSKQCSSDDTETKIQRTEEEEKRHADSLWADFLKDVEPPKKPAKSCSVSPSNSADLRQKLNDCPTASNKVTTTNPMKVTITQVFDFAGESVSVTKEVDANSKEAKKYSTCIDSSIEEDEKQSEYKEASFSKSKRPAGIGNVLDKIMSKKQKINTLDKSLLDWNKFKKEEGIEQEIQQFNKGKDGYLDKIAFLERADLRQFDLERNLRMTNRSKR